MQSKELLLLFLDLLAAFPMTKTLRRAAPLRAEQSLSTPERVAVATAGVAWAGAGVKAFDAEGSRALMSALGVASAPTLEDRFREPAAGFLELTSPVFVLQGVLLTALAAGLFAPKDVARVGSSIAIGMGGTLAALALTVAAGAPVVDQGTVGVLCDLCFLTAAVSLKCVGVSGVEDVPGLLLADASALATENAVVGGVRDKTLATFYRGSALVSILVGAAFALSPVNPIGIFDTELPATRFARTLCGIFILFVITPAENILWRNAKDGSLAATEARALNAAVGGASFLLVTDGQIQVDKQTADLAELIRTQGETSELAQLVLGGDTTRSETNTTAAFSVGLVVALFYLAVAALPPKQES